nr:hypothetical protein [Tanacetum cinerariifolium]
MLCGDDSTASGPGGTKVKYSSYKGLNNNFNSCSGVSVVYAGGETS